MEEHLIRSHRSLGHKSTRVGASHDRELRTAFFNHLSSPLSKELRAQKGVLFECAEMVSSEDLVFRRVYMAYTYMGIPAYMYMCMGINTRVCIYLHVCVYICVSVDVWVSACV